MALGIHPPFALSLLSVNYQSLCKMEGSFPQLPTDWIGTVQHSDFPCFSTRRSLWYSWAVACKWLELSVFFETRCKSQLERIQEEQMSLYNHTKAAHYTCYTMHCLWAYYYTPKIQSFALTVSQADCSLVSWAGFIAALPEPRAAAWWCAPLGAGRAERWARQPGRLLLPWRGLHTCAEQRSHLPQRFPRFLL